MIDDVADPPLRRALRLVRVAHATGLRKDLTVAHPLALASLLLRQGLNVRTLHAVHALRHPERLALVDADRQLTYAQADAEINRVADALAGLGLGRGDAVLLATENRVEYVLTWFALFRLGARAVHVSWRATPAELGYVIDHGDVRALLVSGRSLAAARSARQAHPHVRVIVCGAEADRRGREISYQALVATAATRMPGPPQGPSGGSVVYTSGTTGKPKGAVRDFTAFGLRELVRILERLPLRFGERHLVVAPLYHSAPQVMTLLTTALAGTLHLQPHFDAESVLRALSDRAIESVFLVPTMLRRLLELPTALTAERTTPSLRAVVVGSSEFPQALREAAIARFGAQSVFDFYGATELGWVTLVRGDEMQAHPGTVGRPLAGQRVSILDRGGEPMPLGDVGRIYVANDQTMLGYLHDAPASDETRRGPLVTVEDLGRLDGDGYLYLAGRARDMVKSGGVNLYPAEIEEVLARNPDVREVSVIGTPDATWGEKLVAVVVPRARPFDVATAEERARVHLTSFKVPRRWEIVDELPRNAIGKVLKADLRARYTDSKETNVRPIAPATRDEDSNVVAGRVAAKLMSHTEE